MNVTSATNAAGTAATTSSISSSDPLAGLGPNAFLQMMMAQLENQNPLSASSNDPTQYTAELAQMTALEQETHTAEATARSAALSLLGHTVTYTDKSGASQTGTVQTVDLTASSGPTLTVGGVAGISPSSVSEVS